MNTVKEIQNNMKCTNGFYNISVHLNVVYKHALQ